MNYPNVSVDNYIKYRPAITVAEQWFPFLVHGLLRTDRPNSERLLENEVMSQGLIRQTFLRMHEGSAGN